MAIFCTFPSLLATSSRKYDTQACCKLQGSSNTYADIGLSFKVVRVKECPPPKPLWENTIENLRAILGASKYGRFHFSRDIFL